MSRGDDVSAPDLGEECRDHRDPLQPGEREETVVGFRRPDRTLQRNSTKSPSAVTNPIVAYLD